MSLDFLLNHGVNRSFLAYQSMLDIIFLHTASVVVDDKAHLFIAPSGGGKSTICSLAQENDLGVLGEEFCAIKKDGDKFYAGLFPCFTPYIDPYKEWEIGGVFFLSKSEIDRISSISVIDAIRKAMPEATCFYTEHVPKDKRAHHKKHIFNFLEAMFENVDFKMFDFRKHPEAFLCLKT